MRFGTDNPSILRARPAPFPLISIGAGLACAFQFAGNAFAVTICRVCTMLAYFAVVHFDMAQIMLQRIRTILPFAALFL